MEEMLIGENPMGDWVAFMEMKVPFIGPEEDTQKVGASLEPKIGKLATSSVGYGSIKGRSFRSASRKV